VPLITTPGASNADSYGTIAELDACIASNPYASGWNAVSGADKEAFARMATRLLDAMPGAWTGSPTNPAVQALGWPRIGMRNRNDYPIATNVIPGNLKCAQAEYARLLAENELTAGGSASSLASSGISSVSAAGVSVSVKSASAAGTAVGIPAPGTSKTYAMEAERQAQIPVSVMQFLVPSWIKDPRDIDSPYSGLVVEVL